MDLFKKRLLKYFKKTVKDRHITGNFGKTLEYFRFKIQRIVFYPTNFQMMGCSSKNFKFTKFGLSEYAENHVVGSSNIND